MSTESRFNKGYIALVFLCLVWGTTYLALRIGVNGVPAFLFSAFRHGSGGLLLLLIMYLSGKKGGITWKAFKRQFWPAILMVTLGNGTVAWAEKYIPSGLAALICAMMPVYVVTFNLIAGNVKWSNFAVIAGTLIGLAGMCLLFNDNLTDMANPDYLAGALVTLGAALSWAAGSILISKRSVNNENGNGSPLLNAAFQLIIGGITLGLMSIFLDEPFDISLVTDNNIYAFIYLTLFGSVAAYAAYGYALSKLPVGLVSIYAYVNPVIAVFLGFLVLDEKLTMYTVAALVFTVLGVFLVNYGYKKRASLKS